MTTTTVVGAPCDGGGGVRRLLTAAVAASPRNGIMVRYGTALVPSLSRFRCDVSRVHRRGSWTTLSLLRQRVGSSSRRKTDDAPRGGGGNCGGGDPRSPGV
eukprot:CAMPEP_0197177300 /NCGR_PEP_ID=MMETSP1423-20130617/2955_1 /TAXON_ID=476441 /ORGANISM="Pseudo-nitzschia heimii, Strain UNC1101" /LENGTH=100 /DNA_ID=CAMNT_0042626825 /DNA_START=141 /DNA_END=443 /DNA_ORIENTATION=+